LAGIDNGGRVPGVLDGTGVAAAGLDGLDNTVRVDVALGHLAEHDVLAVEPRGDDGGDEELRAVAVCCESVACVVFCNSGGGGESYVLGPALAMERRNGRLCLSLKFSSENFSP
jgi:hypothetical protein